MALRLIEVIVPTETREQLFDLAEEHTVAGIWSSPLDDQLILVRILVQMENTEALTDVLTQQFDQHESFRLMLFPVEATIPMEEEHEEDKTPDENKVDADSPLRISREELYYDIAGGAQITPVYLVTIVFSTIVAAIGLMRGDVAIVIGSMVIAPLLGPNVALALGSTLGDLALVRRAGSTLSVGLLITLVLSAAIGLILPFDTQVGEILSRTHVSLGSIILALASGSAGALAFTSGISTAVIGVMVAVALLPPAVVAGLLFGAGAFPLAGGAMVLLGANIASINLAGVLTFLVQQIRPRNWWEAEQATRATKIAISLWTAAIGILLALIFLL